MSVGLDAKTLSIIRDIQVSYMPDTVTIHTATITRDRYGKETQSLSAGTSSRAQLSQPTATDNKLLEPQRLQGHLGSETLKIILPHGTTLTSDHKVKTADLRVWRVVKVDTVSAHAVQVEGFITIETVRE